MCDNLHLASVEPLSAGGTVNGLIITLLTDYLLWHLQKANLVPILHHYCSKPAGGWRLCVHGLFLGSDALCIGIYLFIIAAGRSRVLSRWCYIKEIPLVKKKTLCDISHRKGFFVSLLLYNVEQVQIALDNNINPVTEVVITIYLCAETLRIISGSITLF